MTADQFRDARITLDMTQQRLADLLGVNVRTVNRWETGSRKPDPTACRVLGWLRDGKLVL